MARVLALVGYGLGGRAWSSGMEDILAAKLRKLGCICPPTFQWTEWQAQVAEIKRQPILTKIVLIGHSMDANMLPKIAANVTRPIDLLVGYDPTIWYPCGYIPTNVKQAILFHGTNWFNIVGHKKYAVENPAKTKLATYKTSTLHQYIDDDNGLHGITINAVKALLV